MDSIRRLALHLGVSSDEINIRFNDRSTVSEASNIILTNWLHSQKNRIEAYNNLAKGLVAVDLTLIATEVLKYSAEWKKNWQKISIIAEKYVFGTFAHLLFIIETENILQILYTIQNYIFRTFVFLMNKTFQKDIFIFFSGFFNDFF